MSNISPGKTDTEIQNIFEKLELLEKYIEYTHDNVNKVHIKLNKIETEQKESYNNIKYAIRELQTFIKNIISEAKYAIFGILGFYTLYGIYIKEGLSAIILLIMGIAGVYGIYRIINYLKIQFQKFGNGNK